MEEQITIFEVMRTILLWLTPLAFLAGIFLLTGKVDKCIKLEQFLDKEVGIKKRLIPKIETNIYSFQNWLVKKRVMLGLFLIVYSIVSFIVLRK